MPTKNRTAPATSTYSLISNDTLRQMYTSMVQLRARARGKHAAARGLEAVMIATTLQLREHDLILAPAGLFPVARGTSSDSVQRLPLIAHDQLTIGAGAALGQKAAGGNGVVVAFGSAQRTNQDAWQQALHLVAVHRLPAIFVLLPPRNGTRAARDASSVASDAMSAGVIAIPVEAVDAVAIYRVAFESLARARRGTGATLIVATHYELDDAPQRKSDKPTDPLAHMRSYLRNKGISPATSTKKKAR
jgi:TPP-dependent pyruvate/acetoin dehydrogenase alpha subunit